MYRKFFVLNIFKWEILYEKKKMMVDHLTEQLNYLAKYIIAKTVADHNWQWTKFMNERSKFIFEKFKENQ